MGRTRFLGARNIFVSKNFCGEFKRRTLRGGRGSSYGKLIAPQYTRDLSPYRTLCCSSAGFGNPLGIDVTLPPRIGGLEGGKSKYPGRRRSFR